MEEDERLDVATMQGTGIPTPREKGSTSARRAGLPVWSPAVLLILFFACLLEVFYLVIIALAPLPLLHLSNTPLASAWPWTLALSQLFFPGAWAATANPSLTTTWLYQALLTLILAAILAIYTLAIWSMYHWRNTLHRAAFPWLLLLLGVTAIFCLTLLFQPALFSDDVFTYMFSGRLLAFYHADPLNSAPIQFPLDTYLRWFVSGRFTTNFYGPLWLYISAGLVSMSNVPIVTLLLFKGLAIVAHLGNCILVWAIL